MSDDPFHDSKYSLARAQHHISDVKGQINEFIKKEPYTFFIEIDPDTSEEIHKVRFTEPVPFWLPALVSDTVHNLRSALDQAIFTVLFLAHGKQFRNAYFPVSRTKAGFDRAMAARPLKKLPMEILDLICRLEPYEGRNIPLRVLNELSNTNKHATLTTIAIANGGKMRVRGTLAAGFIMPTPVWDRTKDEMEIFRQPIGGASKVNINLSYHVAMYDVEFSNGAPVFLVLNKIVSEVNSVVMALEAETKRIGLVP